MVGGMDPMQPSIAVLAKLGSIAIHADEYLSSDGWPIDRMSLMQALNDPDVQAWLAAMQARALVPVKRIATTPH